MRQILTQMSRNKKIMIVIVVLGIAFSLIGIVSWMPRNEPSYPEISQSTPIGTQAMVTGRAISWGINEEDTPGPYREYPKAEYFVNIAQSIPGNYSISVPLYEGRHYGMGTGEIDAKELLTKIGAATGPCIVFPHIVIVGKKIDTQSYEGYDGQLSTTDYLDLEKVISIG